MVFIKLQIFLENGYHVSCEFIELCIKCILNNGRNVCTNMSEDVIYLGFIPKKIMQKVCTGM